MFGGSVGVKNVSLSPINHAAEGLGSRGLSFRVRVEPLRIRCGIYPLNFRVLRFRVSGCGLRVSGFGFRVTVFSCRVSVFVFQVSGFRFRAEPPTHPARNVSAPPRGIAPRRPPPPEEVMDIRHSRRTKRLCAFDAPNEPTGCGSFTLQTREKTVGLGRTTRGKCMGT